MFREVIPLTLIASAWEWDLPFLNDRARSRRLEVPTMLFNLIVTAIALTVSLGTLVLIRRIW